VDHPVEHHPARFSKSTNQLSTAFGAKSARVRRITAGWPISPYQQSFSWACSEKAPEPQQLDPAGGGVIPCLDCGATKVFADDVFAGGEQLLGEIEVNMRSIDPPLGQPRFKIGMVGMVFVRPNLGFPRRSDKTGDSSLGRAGQRHDGPP
jgi:hypothetical protein